MTLPPPPDQPRAFLCTKCGGHTCEGDIKQKYPVCANCGYLGFADDVGYTPELLQAYGQQCAQHALAKVLEMCVVMHRGWLVNPRQDGCGAAIALNNAAESIKELMK